jgi:hypothetical protein
LATFAAVVIALAMATSTMMAAGAYSRGEADSVLSALLATPAQPAAPRRSLAQNP